MLSITAYSSTYSNLNASDLINDTIADEICADFPDGVHCRVSTILSSAAQHSHGLVGTSPRSTILLEQLPATSCLCKLFNCKKGIFNYHIIVDLALKRRVGCCFIKISEIC